MCDQLLVEGCKLCRFANCKVLDFSDNERSTLFLTKPLKLAKYLFQQLSY